MSQPTSIQPFLASVGASVVLVGTFLTSSAQAQTVDNTSVHVGVVPCKEQLDENGSVLVQIRDQRSSQVVIQKQETRSAGNTSVDFSVSLHEGFYRLTVLSDPCFSDLLLPVVAGDERNITAIEFRGLELGAPGSVFAGSLPLSGYAVSLVYDSGSVAGIAPNVRVSYQGVVSGNAFYFMGIPSGSAHLEVRNATATGTILQFPVGHISQSGSKSLLMRHYTFEDLRQAILASWPSVKVSTLRSHIRR